MKEEDTKFDCILMKIL